MADDLLTLADVIADAQDLSDAEVTDLERRAQFVAMLTPEEASDGTVHKYPKEIGAPVVGFRSANQGRDHDHSTDVEVTATLEYLDFSWKVDVLVAKPRRGGRGPEWKIAREGNRHRNEALFHYEEQLFYGQVAGDAGGFEGFLDQASLSHTDSAMVVDATGTTVDGASSLYAVRVGPDDVAAVYNGDEPVTLGDTVIQEVNDADGKPFHAYCTPGGCHLGLQVGSAKSIGRICNLTLQDGKGLTDSLVAELLEKFPSSRQPTHFLTTRTQKFRLRDSRTATNSTGAPAPIPTEVFGIPLLDLDSLRSDEPIAVASS